VSSRSGEACCKLIYPVTLLYFTYLQPSVQCAAAFVKSRASRLSLLDCVCTDVQTVPDVQSQAAAETEQRAGCR